MKATRKWLLPFAYWIFTASTLLAAALLMVQCASIYWEGTSAANQTASGVYLHPVFSREIVAARFAEISWALMLWLIAFAAVLCCKRIHPVPSPKGAKLPLENRLTLMRNGVVPTLAMAKEERLRHAAKLIAAIVSIGGMAVVAFYVLNPANFASRDLESVMGAMLAYTAPWIALVFVTLAVLSEVCHQSMLRDLKEGKTAAKRSTRLAKPKERRLPIAASLILYAAAIGLLAAGVMNGGMVDVLVKAINICTECIGLG